MFFIYFVCFCIGLYYFFTKNLNYWKSRGIPYEKAVPLFGNFYRLVRGKENISERIREIYNSNPDHPYLGIHVFTLPYLFLRDPGMIKTVLASEFQHFTDRALYTNEKADSTIHYTLFASKSDEWREARKSLNPGFTSGKIKQMFPLIQRCGDQLKQCLYKYDGKEVDFKRITKYYAVDVITSCAFGIDCNCLDENDSIVRDMAMKLIDLQGLKRAFSTFCYFFIPRLVDLFKLQFGDPEACKFFRNIFQETIKQRKERSIQRKDFINLMYELCNSDKNNFNELKMASNSTSFFAAGSTTSAATITYALYELTLNKDIQKRLRQEINKTAEESEGNFTYDNIQGMKYLDMIVHETLRKYPLVPFLDRLVCSDYVFPEGQLKVNKGERILIPVAGLHFDTEYFSNPDVFDPERFNDENKQRIVPFSYLPFGDGPRICIGQRLGLLNVKLALVSILRDFEIDVGQKTTVPVNFDKTSLFLQPKDMYLKINRLKIYC